MLESIQVFKDLEKIAQIIPAPFYWADTNCIIQGFNRYCIDLARESAFQDDKIDLIGKGPFDIYSPISAQIVYQNAQKVMQTGKTLAFEEELIDIVTGVTRCYISSRAPLFNNGVVVGYVCSITEITDTKEKERLQREILESENKSHEIAREQQDQFRKVVSQVVHDLGSPLMALNALLPGCDVLPEVQRGILRNAVIRIRDISNNLFGQFRPKDGPRSVNVICPTLISADILEIITEKKYEYSHLPIEFVSSVSQIGSFAFISINANHFKRMLSNLINNAVDAFNIYAGKVTVYLDVVNNNQVQIIVEDNGVGIPDDVKEKILSNISVTANKANGHGIGFSQIWDTLKNHGGSLSIDSKIGCGTKMIATFPLVKSPDWICNSVELSVDDMIVILDDDPSIHGAWKMRLDKVAPEIKTRHFEQGMDAVNFINSLPADEKQKVLLLTDYELLRQNLNGLDVIDKTKVKRSILVTSHHNNPKVQDLAKQTNTKILPKILAAEVLMII